MDVHCTPYRVRVLYTGCIQYEHCVNLLPSNIYYVNFTWNFSLLHKHCAISAKCKHSGNSLKVDAPSDLLNGGYHYSATVTCISVTLAWLRVGTAEAWNTVRVMVRVCCHRIVVDSPQCTHFLLTPLSVLPEAIGGFLVIYWVSLWTILSWPR